MDNIQLYFYYFQWQTTPAQTCSSISSQHYSWHFVPFKTLLFHYPCGFFFSENTENLSLAEKSPTLFIIKVFPKKIWRKTIWQPPAPCSQLLVFPECQVCQCCRSTEGSSSFPCGKSCSHMEGTKTTFPQLSQVQGEMPPKRVCSTGAGHISRPQIQMTFLTLSKAILSLKCKKVWREKVLFLEALMTTYSLFPLSWSHPCSTKL